MPRLKLTLAYIGTAFSGWQIQALNQGVLARTVQGELESVIREALGLEVRVHAAGRTDAGVHAEAQVAHLDVPPGAMRINWREALNRKLPCDLTILRVEEVAENFHARFDAKGKIYTYALWLEDAYIPPRLREFAWSVPGVLNLEAMMAAARLLEGEHDFAAFQNAGSDPSHTVRTLHSIQCFMLPLPGEAEASPWHLAWRFAGDGFLKQMVRNLVGFMVYVGLGKLTPSDARILFERKERSVLDFPTAPAWGLSLTRVLY